MRRAARRQAARAGRGVRRAHRPSSSSQMLAHLLPNSVCAAMMMASSSPLKGSFFTLGLSWFSHLRCPGAGQSNAGQRAPVRAPPALRGAAAAAGRRGAARGGRRRACAGGGPGAAARGACGPAQGGPRRPSPNGGRGRNQRRRRVCRTRARAAPRPRAPPRARSRTAGGSSCPCAPVCCAR